MTPPTATYVNSAGSAAITDAWIIFTPTPVRTDSQERYHPPVFGSGLLAVFGGAGQPAANTVPNLISSALAAEEFGPTGNGITQVGIFSHASGSPASLNELEIFSIPCESIVTPSANHNLYAPMADTRFMFSTLTANAAHDGNQENKLVQVMSSYLGQDDSFTGAEV